jgi:hypothetical protein
VVANDPMTASVDPGAGPQRQHAVVAQQYRGLSGGAPGERVVRVDVERCAGGDP